MPELPINLAPLVLRPIEHALATAEREALALGVPTHDVLQMLLNHLTSIIACVEPPGVRAELVKNVIANIPSLVRQHVEHRRMTPGGVYMAKPHETPHAP